MKLRQYQKFCLLSLITSALISCTQIDDYMLGKDNTLPPSQLKPFEEKLLLVEKWSVSSGKGGKASDELKLSPVIKGPVVYTANIDGLVQATHKTNGKILWTQQLPDTLTSGPTVANGRIAIATSASTLIVLNQQDGVKIWQANLSSDALAKPVIEGQQVFVKSIDGNLYSFNLNNGEKQWAVDHGAPHLILKASSGPVVSGDLIIAGFSDGKLDGFNKQTGQLMWQRNIAFAGGGSDVERLVDIDADPIVRDSEVYLASYQGYIGALSLASGEFLWQKPASIYKNFAVTGHSIYYVDSDSTIWAVNLSNGQVKWKQDALKARGLTEPVVMGNRIFVGDRLGYLHGFDSINGQFISRVFLNAPVIEPPVISGSSIYVLTANGKLSRYDVRKM